MAARQLEIVGNVARLGRTCVAAVQNLGPMDINEILAGTVPRLPADKFILARDTSRLEKAIDACKPAG